MDANDLITAALKGVAVTLCGRCGGWGHVGLPTLPATCPICGGCGRTTINRLEVPREVAA